MHIGFPLADLVAYNPTTRSTTRPRARAIRARAPWRLCSSLADSGVRVRAHIGFPLADLVAYNQKHNEAHREGNRCAGTLVPLLKPGEQWCCNIRVPPPLLKCPAIQHAL